MGRARERAVDQDSRDDRLAAWQRGTIVSISRLAGRGKAMARAIGIGELLDPLEVGQVIKIRLGEGRALAPTAITRIEAPSADLVRVETHNNRYEFRRVEAVVSPLGSLSLESHESEDDDVGSRTQVLSLEDWPEARPGRFEAGARVRITQERDGETRELGSGVLLVDLTPGQSASFSVAESIVGTSAIRSIVELSKDAIRIETGNSAYELALDHEDREA